MKIKGPYKIIWEDHCSFRLCRWRSIEEVVSGLSNEPVIIESYGYILKETKKYIILASHFNPNDNVFIGEMKILKNTILEKKKLIEE